MLGSFNYCDFSNQKKDLIEGNERRLTLVSEVVKNGLISLMLQGKGKEFDKFITGLMTEDLQAIKLYDPGGKLFASTDMNGKNLLAVPLSPQVIKDKDNIPASSFMPIYNSKPCQGCHGKDREILTVLGIELSSRYTRDRINSLRRNFLVAFCLSFFALFLPLFFLLDRFVVKRLNGMSENIRKVSAGDFSVRVPSLGRDELCEIARELNKVLSVIESTKDRLEAGHGEAMRKMEKMASLGELAAAIAHEIKNPLAGISGAIQVLAEDIPYNDPRKEIIKEILGEIDRLDQSIKNLLNFARPPDIRPVMTYLMPIAERAMRILSKQAQMQKVEIKVTQVIEREPAQVDPEQMEQVFLNIMLNALHSMPSGGILGIGVNPRDEGHAEVVFSDTGSGISSEALKEIFKPFFSTKHTGTGLGLAIAKNIVEKHGGTIEATSQAGLGSTFHVIIPYRNNLSDGQS